MQRLHSHVRGARRYGPAGKVAFEPVRLPRAG